jgi:glycosyltransferase involved in cell wall biosynthesis
MHGSKFTKENIKRSSRPLKILFSTVYTARPKMHGGYRAYLELCEKFENENVDVYSLVNSRAPTGAGKQLTFSYPQVCKPRRLWLYLAILKTIINLRIAISKIKPDVVIDPGQDRLNNIALLAIKLTTKTPAVMIFHHWSFKYKFSEMCKEFIRMGRFWFLTSVEWWLTVLALRLSTFVISISAFSVEQLKKLGVRKEKVAVSGVGINYEEVEKASPATERFDGVFIGRMMVEKGIFDLIPIWKHVVEKKCDARLAVIGAESKLKEQWLSEVRRANLEKNIVYLGSIKDDERVYGLLKSAKVFVFPSHIEGFCIVVGEAMVAGLPVVCWDIPALREVYGKSTAVKFLPKGRFEDFSQEICRLLTDEKYRLSVGDAGRLYPLRFSWSNVARRQLKILESIVAT